MLSTKAASAFAALKEKNQHMEKCLARYTIPGLQVKMDDIAGVQVM